VHTDVTNIALNYKYILYTEIAHTNCFISSSNIYTSKTLVLSFSALFTYPSVNKKLYYNSGLSVNKKLYYNSGLSLNKSINLISIGL